MRYVITIIVIILIGLGIYGLAVGWFTGSAPADIDTATTTPATDTGTTSDRSADTDTPEQAEAGPTEVIGTSVEGNEIVAHHYGSGDKELLLVGGIHGGYEWNTVLLARQVMNYLDENTDVIPQNTTVTVVPLLNPDGLSEVVGTTGQFTKADVPAQENTVPGRFNANDVDLNRNFDCNWQSDAKWQDRTVSGGSEPFSEPEAQAFRQYVQSNSPDAAVFLFSAAGGVYTSSCNGEPLSDTTQLMNAYADASGYPAAGEFTAYNVTGDATDWLAKQGIPAISVLLETHSDVEWEKNRQGLNAVLDWMRQQS